VLKKSDGLINWSDPATFIERAVRGFQPWPNAFTSYQKRRLIVWRAEVLAEGPTEGAPGSVALAHGGDLVVSCGNNTSLRLLEVQPEAKRRMSAKDFLNGTHLKAGDRFG
jgi:methionyl-tRNA formyltransferase